MPDTVLTGSLTVADGTGGVNPPAGSVLEIGCQDHPAVSLDLEGAFTGTVVIEASAEDAPAVDWFTPVVLTATGVAGTTSLTVAARRFINAAGLARVRLRCTAFTSGPMTATLRAGQGFVSSGGGGGGGGGAVTVADGADVTLGTTTDAGIITNIAGTAIGFLRGSIIQWAAFLARFPAALVSGRLDVNIGAPATLPVSAAALPLPTGAATETTLAAQSAKLPAALVNGALIFTGDTAHAVTDAGNPVETGSQAIAFGTSPTPVTAGQRVRSYATRGGIPWHIGGHPNIQTFGVQYTTAQTNVAVIAGVAATKLIVTKVSVKTANANTVDVSCRLGFGATVPAYGSAQLLGTHPGIAAGSGFTEGDGSAVIGASASADPLSFTCSAPTGGSVDLLVTYYALSE